MIKAGQRRLTVAIEPLRNCREKRKKICPAQYGSATKTFQRKLLYPGRIQQFLRGEQEPFWCSMHHIRDEPPALKLLKSTPADGCNAQMMQGDLVEIQDCMRRKHFNKDTIELIKKANAVRTKSYKPPLPADLAILMSHLEALVVRLREELPETFEEKTLATHESESAFLFGKAGGCLFICVVRPRHHQERTRYHSCRSSGGQAIRSLLEKSSKRACAEGERGTRA
uniref:Uncharacterized protein n=1 Tax=Oryza punctata TaxID=4537 RepID=A0A0E0JXH9_ORYPU